MKSPSKTRILFYKNFLNEKIHLKLEGSTPTHKEAEVCEDDLPVCFHLYILDITDYILTVCVCVRVCVCMYVAGGSPCPPMCQAMSQNSVRVKPIPTQDLADGGVVHVREGLQDPPALILGPHHEGIHGPLDVPGRGRGPGPGVVALGRSRNGAYT